MTLSRGSRAQSAEAYPMEESQLLMEMFRGKKISGLELNTEAVTKGLGL